MTSLIFLLVVNYLSFFLIFLQEGRGVSFGIYEIKKGLTPLGWAAIVIFPTALIFGAIYLVIRILKKPKLK